MTAAGCHGGGVVVSRLPISSSPRAKEEEEEEEEQKRAKRQVRGFLGLGAGRA